MDVAKFDLRPVNFYIFLDNCDWMISYGIDNFVAKPVVLLDFTFDEWHEFWMKGVFRIRFVKSGVIFEGLLHGTLEVQRQRLENPLFVGSWSQIYLEHLISG